MPNNITDQHVPLRLLDCFGLLTPSFLLESTTVFGTVDGLRGLGGFGGEVAASRVVGEFVKNAVGEGIVIVSISDNGAHLTTHSPFGQYVR